MHNADQTVKAWSALSAELLLSIRNPTVFIVATNTFVSFMHGTMP